MPLFVAPLDFEVPTLPSAAAYADTFLIEGGKPKFSNGASWLDLSAPVTAGTTGQFWRGDVGWSNNLVGPLGVGANLTPAFGIRVGLALTGAVNTTSIQAYNTVQSDVTSTHYYFATSAALAAVSFNLSTLTHYHTAQVAFTGGATVTDQIGFRVLSQLTGATNNYGFRSDLTYATGRWGVYTGTADNAYAGNSRFGSTAAPTAKVHMAAGTTAASTAPLKFTSGALMTTAEAGAVEFLTDAFYGTITTGAARKRFLLDNDIGVNVQAYDAQLASLAALTYAGNGGKFVRLNAGATDFEFITLAGGGDALTTNPLSQFAATTSAQLLGVISDETGTGALVFADSPALAGTPTAPTADVNTNTTQLATTEFVVAEIAATPAGLSQPQIMARSLGC